jgi:hypothetical protein
MPEITITEVRIKDKKIHFHEPYKVTIARSGDLLTATDPTISLYVFASTKDELIKEVEGMLAMTWIAYVWRDEERLSESAKEVRKQLKLLAYEKDYDRTFKERWKDFYNEKIRPDLERIS